MACDGDGWKRFRPHAVGDLDQHPGAGGRRPIEERRRGSRKTRRCAPRWSVERIAGDGYSYARIIHVTDGSAALNRTVSGPPCPPSVGNVPLQRFGVENSCSQN
jgi:hypothetical protein